MVHANIKIQTIWYTAIWPAIHIFQYPLLNVRGTFNFVIFTFFKAKLNGRKINFPSAYSIRFFFKRRLLWTQN